MTARPKKFGGDKRLFDCDLRDDGARDRLEFARLR
jgi:hypothetical protein